MVECKETYIGTHRITAGTQAEVVARTDADRPCVMLRITEPQKGTELQIGEEHEVPTSDFAQFWQTVPTATPAWGDDDSGKMRQRHPADPEFGR
jgi:hypothetical protein